MILGKSDPVHSVDCCFCQTSILQISFIQILSYVPLFQHTCYLDSPLPGWLSTVPPRNLYQNHYTQALYLCSPFFSTEAALCLIKKKETIKERTVEKQLPWAFKSSKRLFPHFIFLLHWLFTHWSWTVVYITVWVECHSRRLVSVLITYQSDRRPRSRHLIMEPLARRASGRQW